MADHKKGTPKPENKENIPEEEIVEFESDYDFWSDVKTEYGEIESRQELNLILKKIATEIQREKEKAKKTKSMVAKRNKAAIKKNRDEKKAKKHALRALSPAQRSAYKQKLEDEAVAAKLAAEKEKNAAKQKKQDEKIQNKEKKAADQQYRMQEKLFLMSLTPYEKSLYRFQKSAKQKIDEANAKKKAVVEDQQAIKHSKILPVGGFLKVLFICMAITAVLAYCGTNIYLDTQYYTEKIAELKDGIDEYDVKLDGDMAVGVSDLESGLSVYQQILSNAPVITNQLEKLNTTYFWVLEKETTESIGLDAVQVEANALKIVIDQIQTVVDSNKKFTEDLDTAYQADVSITDLRASLDPYAAKIAAIKSDFESISLPKGLPEHKEGYLEKIAANETYYNAMVSYLDELVTIRETLTDANEVIAEAKSMRPHSGSLSYQVDQYIEEMDSVYQADRKISAANNNVDYAIIIGKKQLADVGHSLITEESLDFYNDMLDLKDIIKGSDKIQNNCVDLPYPDEEPSYDQTILSHISLGTTDEALEANKELQTRIAEITAPEKMSNNLRAYTTGLEIRTEFLELQKQYIDYEKEKAALYADYETAKAEFSAAEVKANLEKSNNGRTDEYYTLRQAQYDAEDKMGDAWDTAYEAADAIQVKMKKVRTDAIAKKEEYEDYMDY